MPGRVKVTSLERGSGKESYWRSGSPVRTRRQLLGWAWPWLRRIIPAVALGAIGVLTIQTGQVFLNSDSRFRFAADAAGLRIKGLRHLDPGAVRELFAVDSGSSLSAIPLAERREALLAAPWVAEVSIVRLWPNQLRVEVREHQPIAYARIVNGKGADTLLVWTENGELQPPPPGFRSTLPVVSGVGPEMTLAERRVRLALLERLRAELDGSEPRYMPQLSELDLRDPENVIATTVREGVTYELQLGDEKFRHRYEIFLKYLDSWRKEFPSLQRVDLRFKGSVAVE